MGGPRNLHHGLAPPLGPFFVPSRTWAGRLYTVWVLGDRACCNCLGARTGWVRHCYHEKEVIEMTQALTTIRPEDAAALTPVKVSRPRSLVPHPSDLQAYVLIARNAPQAAGFALPKGVNHPAKAFAIMLSGYELGIGPMTAMRHITAVNGRTEPDAQLMMGICLANDATCEFNWKELSDTVATVEIVRQGTSRGEFTYTLEHAKQAGQYDPDNPKMRPKVASWKRGDDGRNIPVYAQDADGRTVMEPEPVGYWATHTRLALAYNAARLGMKLACPDLINNVLGAMMGGEAMLGAVEMGEAPADAWDQVPDINSPGDFPDRPRQEAPRRSDSGGGWDSAPRQETRPQRPPGASGGAKTAAQWEADLNEALAAFGVDAPVVANIVGGEKVGDVIRYLAKEKIDLAELMQRARATMDTGEIPATESFQGEVVLDGAKLDDQEGD